MIRAISLLNGLVFFAPVALLVRTEKGITTSEFFVLQAILALGIFLFEIPSGYMADRVGYRKTLIISQCLLFAARFLLWIADSFYWFLAEAIVEAVAFSFSSGTMEAAIYCEEPQHYGEEMAKVGNYGTVSFIVSTLCYTPMYYWYGLEGLLVATVISSFLGMVVTFFLQERKEPVHHGEQIEKIRGNLKKEEDKQKNKYKYQLRHKELENQRFDKKKLVIFIGTLSILKSACSVGFFAVNFFYVIKLQQMGLSILWMSNIILFYSIVQISVPKWIKIAKNRYAAKQVLLLVSAITTGFFFYLAWSASLLCVWIMLLLPTLLSMIDIELGELENQWIDYFKQQENRATMISFSSMGQNAMEIVFLLGANFFSALSINISFFIAGLGSMIIALFMLRRNK